MTTTYSAEALQGVSDIAARFRVSAGFGTRFTDQVQAAIEAGLAYDADPYYMMSDQLLAPSAALTDLGIEVARAQGYLVPCVCPGCNREAAPAAEREGYCASCFGQGNRRSQFGGWINGNQCYDHYLKTHPEAAAERTRRIDDSKVRYGTRFARADRNDFGRRQRYEDALEYVDPADQRTYEPKGFDANARWR